MRFEVVPILAMAREVYAMPRNMDRFRAYLKTMLNEDGDDVAFVPMVAMNPMGREHVLAAVDHLLAMDAEALVAKALRDVEKELQQPEVALKVGITVLDDVRGGWTQTEMSEAEFYFGTREPRKNDRRRNWLTILTWTKRLPDRASLLQETRAAAYRYHHQAIHGRATTLRAAIAQEGAAWRFAGRSPTLPPDAIAAARAALEPHLDDARFATLFAGMYGDRAAAELGHKPLGVPERAGFEVGLASG